MAVADQETVFPHVGNGSTTIFAYGCQILAASDLIVYVDDQVTTTGFTVNNVGSPTGGTVSFNSPPANGVAIRLERIIKLERSTDYQQNGDFLSLIVNRDFDRLWMALQQFEEVLGVHPGTISRALVLGRGDTNGAGAYRALQNRIQDLADPVNSQDAINLRWLQTQLSALAADGSGQFVTQLLANASDPTLGIALVGGAGRVVNSIASLRTLPKTGSKYACVTGYYAAGDGGGGAYYYDAADTTTADNGGTVIVASDGGRWKLIVGDELSVRQFGAKGDGATNDTSAIQACYTAGAGKTIDHGDGYTYIINASLTMTTGSIYKGKSIIKALAAAGIAGAMMNAASKSGIRITELEIDGNAANNGANYGIKFASGSHNLIDHDVQVHDTLQAGCVIESEDGTKVFGRYVNCGRVSGTDNHGIMVYSIGATPVKNVTVTARVVGAYRKGITTYSASPGTVVGVRIADCDVSGCGLGGIYIANAPGGIDQDGIVLDGNQAYSNYVNFVIDNCKNVSGSGNVSRSSTGAHGVLIEHSDDVSLGIVDSDAYTGGIRVNGGLRVNLVNPVVARPNRSIGGFGPGIELLDSTYCVVDNPIVTDDSGPRMTHGIIEQGTSDYNHIDGGIVTNATTAQVTIIGGNSSLHRRSGRNHGISVATPLNTLDVDGGLTLRGKSITVANGMNAGVSLPANSGFIVLGGPTAAYSIGGIAGGHDGRCLTLVNYTTQTLTLVHQEATATATNRLTLAGGANRTVASFGAVELRYSSQVNAWIVVG